MIHEHFSESGVDFCHKIEHKIIFQTISKSKFNDIFNIIS
jgi:hypothetical protein